MRALCFIVAGVLLMACGCQTQGPSPEIKAAAEKAIHDTEVAWSKTAEANNVDGFVSYYADDASLFVPNAPIATGKDAIRAAAKNMFAMPGFALTFTGNKVEAAASGDIGYTTGAYSLGMNGPDGKPMTDRGKYVTVFKKQADGSWKAVADIFNTDTPPPAAH